MNAQLAYPNELKVTTWEKDKKSGFAGASDVADKLKSLQKKHDAVNWKMFDPGWASEAKTAADLQEAFALRDRLYRSSVFALKKDALGVASAAKAEEKKAAKPWLDTLKAIGKSANGYADDVDNGIDALKAALDKAVNALPDDDEEDEESAPKALVDPKILAKQLKLCKSDPDRVMRFAFIDAKGDQAAIFAMHPRMSAKKMFSTLQAATGIKTGAFGTAWIQVDGEFRGTCLMLQLDKPLSGLVKKVKAPVKAAGFKIAKAVLWNADGSVFEQEDETDDGKAEGGAGAGAAGAAGPTPPQGPTQTAPTAKKVAPEMEALMARAAAVATQVAAAGNALDATKAQDAKLRASEALMSGRKGEWERADALMKQAEAVLAGIKAASGAASAGAGSSATATPTAGADAGAGGDEPMARGTAKAPPIEALAFRNRLTALVPRMKPVEAAGGDVAAQIKAKRDEAVALVRLKGAGPAEFAKAGALLDDIDALIGGSGAEAPSRGAPRTAAATGAKVVFQQTRLEWDTTRKQVQVELKKLEDSILAETRGEADSSQIAQNSKVLYTVLDHLDERLIDKLDEALSAGTPEARTGFTQEAREIVDEYIDYVSSDELLRDIDDNGFVDIRIGAMLTQRLSAMAVQLKSAVAA